MHGKDLFDRSASGPLKLSYEDMCWGKILSDASTKRINIHV